MTRVKKEIYFYKPIMELKNPNFAITQILKYVQYIPLIQEES